MSSFCASAAAAPRFARRNNRELRYTNKICSAQIRTAECIAITRRRQPVSRSSRLHAAVGWLVACCGDRVMQSLCGAALAKSVSIRTIRTRTHTYRTHARTNTEPAATDRFAKMCVGVACCYPSSLLPVVIQQAASSSTHTTYKTLMPMYTTHPHSLAPRSTARHITVHNIRVYDGGQPHHHRPTERRPIDQQSTSSQSLSPILLISRTKIYYTHHAHSLKLTQDKSRYHARQVNRRAADGRTHTHHTNKTSLRRTASRRGMLNVWHIYANYSCGGRGLRIDMCS